MAIILVGVETGVTGGTDTVTISTPVGTVAGTVLIAAFPVVTDFFTVPSDFTPLQDLVGISGTWVKSYYRICDGSEAASYSWAYAGGSARTPGFVAAYSGCEPTHPLDSWSWEGDGSGAFASATTLELFSIVKHTANTMLLAIGATHNLVSTTTWGAVPTGMTQRVNLTDSSGVGLTTYSLSLYDQIQGAAGLMAASKTLTASAAGPMTGVFILLRESGQADDTASLTQVDEYELIGCPDHPYPRRHQDTSYLFLTAPIQVGPDDKTKLQKINRLTDAITTELIFFLNHGDSALTLDRVATPGGLVTDPAHLYWGDNSTYTGQAQIHRNQTSNFTEVNAVDFNTPGQDNPPRLEVGRLGSWSENYLAELNTDPADSNFYIYNRTTFALVATIDLISAGVLFATSLACDKDGDFWVIAAGVIGKIDSSLAVVNVYDLSTDLPEGSEIGAVDDDDSLIIMESPRDSLPGVPRGRIGKVSAVDGSLLGTIAYGKHIDHAAATLQNGPLSIGGTLQYWFGAGNSNDGGTVTALGPSSPEVLRLDPLTFTLTDWKSLDPLAYYHASHVTVDSSPSPAKVWMIAAANTDTVPDSLPDKLVYFTLSAASMPVASLGGLIPWESLYPPPPALNCPPKAVVWGGTDTRTLSWGADCPPTLEWGGVDTRVLRW